MSCATQGFKIWWGSVILYVELVVLEDPLEIDGGTVLHPSPEQCRMQNSQSKHGSRLICWGK